MKNVNMTVKGDKLTIEIDLSADHGETASGNKKIATTGGNVTVPGTDDVKIGLNVYQPKS